LRDHLSPNPNQQWDDHNYSKGLADLIRNIVGRKNEIPSGDLKAWYDELARLSEARRYFFSSNRYIFERTN
jgi:arsenite methyltransferase